MSEPSQPDPSPASNSGDDSTSVARQSIEGIFVEALGKSLPDERRAFLDSACEGDPEKRRRVDALLLAYDDAGSFLQHPAGDWKRPPGPAAAVDSQGIPIGLLQPSDKPGCLGMLGPYEVQQFLGRGGMGIVLRALDPQLNRVVAIKVLSPELAAEVSSRRRFLREARAAAAVSHPHVVTIHAVAVDDDRLPYLVMECIVGRTLQHKIDQTGVLKMTEILRIGTQIAEGLAAAHKQGLVHRDIKPANILLENGVERVKITDFGLARSVDDAGITRTGEVSGTPQYMSPEQALGQHVDHRSDLFSLGCVLYAMCAGRPPFRGDNVAVVVKRICDETPRPIAEINAEVPGWLIQTIERLLAKEPAHRFQSAAEVADVLSGQLAHAQQPHGGYVPPVSSGLPRPRLEDHPVRNGSAIANLANPAPNWLAVTAFGAVGMLIGRLMPAPTFESTCFVWLLAFGSSVFFFKRGTSAGWNKYQVAGWVVTGPITTFMGFMVGNQIYHQHRNDSGYADLALLVLGIGFLVYVFRRGMMHPVGAIAGTAKPPAVLPQMTAAAHVPATAARPWKMAGWLVVALLSLVLLVPCGIGVALLVPIISYRQAEAEMGILTIDYDDNAEPLLDVRIRGADRTSVTNVHPVTSNPFTIRLRPGQYTLTATKLFVKEKETATTPAVSFIVQKAKETRLNLAAEQSHVN